MELKQILREQIKNYLEKEVQARDNYLIYAATRYAAKAEALLEVLTYLERSGERDGSDD